MKNPDSYDQKPFCVSAQGQRMRNDSKCFNIALLWGFCEIFLLLENITRGLVVVLIYDSLRVKEASKQQNLFWYIFFHLSVLFDRAILRKYLVLYETRCKT